MNALKCFIKSMIWPVFFCILSIFIDWSLQDVFHINKKYDIFHTDTKNTKALHDIQNIQFIIFVLSVSCIILNIILFSKNKFLEKAKLNNVDFAFFSILIKIIIFLVAISIILQKFKIDISSILAIGGIGGIAAGFAAKDLLANIFAFITIILDKQFKVGDHISCLDGKNNIEGVVDKIDLRCTKIITFKKRKIYVPNSLFSTMALQNNSPMTCKRMKENILIACDNVEKTSNIISEIKKYLNTANSISKDCVLICKLIEIKKYLDSSDLISKDKIVICNLVEVDEHLFKILIYVFIKSKTWSEFLEAKEQILFDVLKIIDIAGGKLIQTENV